MDICYKNSTIVMMRAAMEQKHEFSSTVWLVSLEE